jgi:protein TonB
MRSSDCASPETGLKHSDSRGGRPGRDPRTRSSALFPFNANATVGGSGRFMTTPSVIAEPANRARYPRRLTVAAALALLVHLGLLFLAAGGRGQTPADTARSIAVTLEGGAAAPVARPRPTVFDTTAAASAVDATTAADARNTPATPAVSSLFTDAILAALAPDFRYPPIARRLGWQGEVRVRIHIDRQGQFQTIELAHSSGHAVLDEAALESLQHLRQLPASVPAPLRAMVVVVPVIYRLTAG